MSNFAERYGPWAIVAGASEGTGRAFAHTLAEKYNLEMDYRRYEPTIIYINGQYWGIYEIRERVDKEHKKYYYGKDKPDLDQLQNWGGLTVTGTEFDVTSPQGLVTTTSQFPA